MNNQTHKPSQDKREEIDEIDTSWRETINFFKENGIEGIEIVALGSSNPQDKADWIEAQAKKGWNDIRFMDDSHKNIAAVRAMANNYPHV